MRTFKKLSKRSRIIITSIIALLAAGLLIAGGLYLFIASKILSPVYEPDLIIPSPDGRHELVICEWGYLIGSGAEIYIRKPGQDKWYNSWKKTQIGTTGTGDGYLSFANDMYYVEWENDKVTIYYYTACGIETANDPSTWCGIVSYDLDKG